MRAERVVKIPGRRTGTYWLCLHINIERHGTLSVRPPVPLLPKTPGHSPTKILMGNLPVGGKKSIHSRVCYTNL